MQPRAPATPQPGTHGLATAARALTLHFWWVDRSFSCVSQTSSILSSSSCRAMGGADGRARRQAKGTGSAGLVARSTGHLCSLGLATDPNPKLQPSCGPSSGLPDRPAPWLVSQLATKGPSSPHLASQREPARVEGRPDGAPGHKSAGGRLQVRAAFNLDELKRAFAQQHGELQVEPDRRKALRKSASLA